MVSSFQHSVLDSSMVRFYVHDSKLELPDLERTKFKIGMRPGIDKEVKFSKTVISSISRPGKLCELDTTGTETCIRKFVNPFYDIYASFLVLLHSGKKKQILGAEIYFFKSTSKLLFFFFFKHHNLHKFYFINKTYKIKVLLRDQSWLLDPENPKNPKHKSKKSNYNFNN